MLTFIDSLKDQSKDFYQSRKFELEITNFVKSHEFSNDDIQLLRENLKQHDDVGFISYLILFTYYRRHQQIGNLIDLHEIAKDNYNDNNYPILKHIDFIYKALLVRNSSELSTLVTDMRKTLTDGQNHWKSHSGFVHQYCELVASLGETNDELKKTNKEQVEYAYNLLINIMKDEAYPKFYLTKARLELLLDKYDDAISNIDLSIQYEDQRSKDYVITIRRLKEYRLQANLMRIKHENEIHFEETKKKLERANKKMEGNNVKIVALFSSLISLVLGNVSLTASDNTNPMNIMVAFTGSVFIVLGIILSIITVLGYDKDLTKSQKVFSVLIIVTIIIVGIGLMVFAVLRG